jgi:hypothetical protein
MSEQMTRTQVAHLLVAFVDTPRLAPSARMLFRRLPVPLDKPVCKSNAHVKTGTTGIPDRRAVYTPVKLPLD